MKGPLNRGAPKNPYEQQYSCRFSWRTVFSRFSRRKPELVPRTQVPGWAWALVNTQWTYMFVPVGCITRANAHAKP